MFIPKEITDKFKKETAKIMKDVSNTKTKYESHPVSCLCERCLPVVHEIFKRNGWKVGGEK